MSRRALAFVIVFVIVAAIGGARPRAASATAPPTAEARPSILAFVPAESFGALARLRAELGMAGLDLRLAQLEPWPPSRVRMEAVARQEGAVAALALIPEEGSGATQVWVVDRVTGKTVLRLFRAPPGHEDEADLLAISAVETLRATLMEITLARRVEGELPPPPAVRALVAPERGRFAASVALAGSFSQGGLGPTLHLALSGTVALRRRLRLGVEGFLPLSGANATGPEGEADVRAWLAGPLIEASLTDPNGRADVRLGAGAWATLVRMRGEASEPYAGTTADVPTLLPHLDLMLGWRFARRLTVSARFSAAVAAPEVVVRFPGREAASWGRPLGLAALVIETRLD